MEPTRRERAEQIALDAAHAAPGGASHIELLDRLQRRGYDADEGLDLLDDLREDGRLRLRAGRWQPTAPRDRPG